MSRDIKFRGKASDGEWVYGYHVVDNEGWHLILDPNNPINKGDSWGQFDVNPETVGEFTGLQDKNGNDIYEGDILLNHVFGDEWEVCFEDGSFVVKLLEEYDPKRHTEYLGGLVDFEIVSNVHENSELLEESA